MEDKEQYETTGERLTRVIEEYQRRTAALEDLEDRLYTRERKLEEERIRAADWNEKTQNFEKWSVRFAFLREVLTVIFLALAVFAALTGNHERVKAAKERLSLIQLVAEQNARLEQEIVPRPLITVESSGDGGRDGATPDLGERN